MFLNLRELEIQYLIGSLNFVKLKIIMVIQIVIFVLKIELVILYLQNVVTRKFVLVVYRLKNLIVVLFVEKNINNTIFNT
jgi:hypothetical protein